MVTKLIKVTLIKKDDFNTIVEVTYSNQEMFKKPEIITRMAFKDSVYYKWLDNGEFVEKIDRSIKIIVDLGFADFDV
jgi:hypothetical protein